MVEVVELAPPETCGEALVTARIDKVARAIRFMRAPCK